MGWIDEDVSAQFAHWEERGRGWRVWPAPVELEPPFVPFRGYAPDTSQFVDDGKRPSRITSALTKIGLLIPSPSKPQEPEEEPEPEPQFTERSGVVELQLSLPKKFAAKMADITPMLRQLGLCNEPIAFEILGTHERITVQFAAAESDAPTIRRQLKAHFPEVVVTEANGALVSAWGDTKEVEYYVVEFGLAREFAFPLADLNSDPFTGLVGTMEELASGEVGLFQVLFQPVVNPWADHLLRAVTDTTGKPLFQNAPEITQLAQEKTSSPLFAAVVRMAIKAGNFDRILELAREMAGALRLYARLDGNELIPLENNDYPFESHLEDVVLRQSRRSGMLLNADELLGFVHLPTADVHSVRLQRDVLKTKAAPHIGATGLLLGNNTHAGKTVEVRLDAAARSKHAHIIGASGSGKSTLLLNLIRQDLENGEGIAVLDPHGDLVDAVLGMIPENRIEDVVLLDPSDATHAVGFNILSAHSEMEKTLLASDLVSVFQRLSTSWGDQMNSVFQNAIMAFLESREGGTLAELRRFLIEPDFRKQFLQTVEDSEVLYYWQKGFPQLTGNKSVGPIVTRLDAFLLPKPIRHMVSQRENRLDFANIMDTRKIFLAKLSHGQMGKENSFLLGSLLVGKFQETAMSRQSRDAASRQAFTLLVDEFQNFITPSMAEILTGTRKYGLSLILAHQELRQLEREREVASAVLGAHTRICFRLGDDDARKLADGFSSFDAHDLQNLSVGQAICRLERSDADFNLSVPKLEMPDTGMRERVITRSREKYSRLRSEVEAELRQRLQPTADKPAPLKAKPAPEAPKAEVPQPLPPKPEPAVVAPLAASPVLPVSDLKPPSDRGIGGNQHNLIRERIEAVARQLGYSTSREHKLEMGEKVDVVFEKPERAIACEIGISTTIDHEVGNASKCLKASFQLVALISIGEERLAKTKQAILGCLPPEAAARVGYFTPDQFIAHLQALSAQDVNSPPTPPKPSEAAYGKWKVKTKHAPLTPEEQQQKEDLAYRTIAETMRQAKKK